MHQLNLRVQATHISQCSVEVDESAFVIKIDRCIKLAHNLTQFFDIKVLHDLAFCYFVFDLYFVVCMKINSVTQLLQHIVEHDFRELIIGRDR